MSEQDTTQFHQVRDWGILRRNMYFFDVNISILIYQSIYINQFFDVSILIHLSHKT